ncbi:hypothetical protein LCGC14_1252660, partial [marine sediment metagenome]
GTDVQAWDVNTTVLGSTIDEGEIDYSTGVSIASAVTKYKSFTINDPQDMGGGSGNSPFRLFPSITLLHPNGIFIVALEISSQHGSSLSSDVNFSEWSAGSSVFNIGSITTVSNTGSSVEELTSGATSVIEGGNEIFVHLDNTTGVSILSGSLVYFPR